MNEEEEKRKWKSEMQRDSKEQTKNQQSSIKQRAMKRIPVNLDLSQCLNTKVGKR